MEINSFNTADAHEAGAKMRVKDQFGNDTDCYITIVGVDSHDWQSIQQTEMKRAAMEGIGLSDESQADKLDAETMKYARAIKSWEGFTQDGEAVEFSVEKAYSLLKQAPYIKLQLTLFVFDRANFTQV